MRRSVAQVRLGMSSRGCGEEKRILASRQRFHHKEKAGRESMTGADCSSVVFIVTLGLPTRSPSCMCESSPGVCGKLTPLNWVRLITDFDIAPPRREVCQWREPHLRTWGLAAGKARGELVAIGVARRIPIIVCKLTRQCFVAFTGNGIGSMTHECGWLGKTYHMLTRHSLSTRFCSSALAHLAAILEATYSSSSSPKICVSTYSASRRSLYFSG